MSTNPPDTDNDGDHEAPQQELSLEQLSQAYAQVMREQGRPEDADGPMETEDDVAASEEEPKEEAKPTKKKKALEAVDAEDNAACPVSPKSIVEAILFVGTPSGVKMSLRKIAAVMRDVSPKEVKKIIAELNKSYQDENAAYRIVGENGDYKMKLTDDLLPVQNHFFGRNRPTKLAQGAIDVLAIVAYNQPITRKQVDQIRKRPSGNVLNQLLKRELIQIQEADGTQETAYSTSDRFLKLFGLGTLDDLPQTSVVSDLEELTDA